jgi:hypothetical protein
MDLFRTVVFRRDELDTGHPRDHAIIVVMSVAATSVLILDNGAYNIKAGRAGIDVDPK